MARLLLRIVSGGQSGVDRAALDFAARRGFGFGGWCPRGGWAEDFPDPPGVLARYPQLAETPAADPAQRTRWNVRDSDATLILVSGGIDVSEGCEATLAAALALARQHLTVHLSGGDAGPARAWLARTAPRTLNIAGPRESQSPGIYRAATLFLENLLADGAPPPARR